MTILLSGGAKNGKSALAQQLTCSLAGIGPRYYAATMIPRDEEDFARIARHQKEREGLGFTTILCGKSIFHSIINKKYNGSFLFDSVTALLANAMFPGSEPDWAAPKRVEAELLALADWAQHTVFVSDAIYCDTGRYDWLTQAYRQSLAQIDRALAARCDCVAELCAGQVVVYKGALPV